MLNPSGMCHCGCGEYAPLARQSDKARGWVKDEPIRYIAGHCPPPVRRGKDNNMYRSDVVEPPNPSGLCMCGCGEKTGLALATNVKRGYLKGHPQRFVRGHHPPQGKGADHHCWRGGRSVMAGGYVRLRRPADPEAGSAGDGYVYEHRLAARGLVGRILGPHEHVHHINGDKQDNRLENLQIVGNAEHQRLHAELRRQAA